MSDVAELKQFVVVHARGQRLRGYAEVLERIHTDGHGPGSWVGEWCRAAEAYQRQGRLLDACRHYAMARFPYVDGPARAEAAERCVAAFDGWRAAAGGHIERLTLELPDGPVPSWVTGLSATRPRPVVVVMGGIVTVKEQWAPALSLYRRLGFAAVAAELPGVGENPLRYETGSWRMLPGILDAISDRADVTKAYAVTLSFSGHLALRAAVEDARIRAVITAGAPLREFFTDVHWQRRLPRITVDALARLMDTQPAQIPGGLSEWALTGEYLAGLDIPVGYVASRRDEIIPSGEVAFLRGHVRSLRLLEHDDVHGAPAHVAVTQLWMIRTLLAMYGARDWRSAAVGLLWHARPPSRRRARPAI